MHKFTPDYNVPPSETVKELMEEYDMTMELLAAKTGFEYKTIENILSNEQKINKEIAQSFEKIFKIPMSFWVNLQNNYDDRRNRQL